jgi:Recombination endonuclease VII
MVSQSALNASKRYRARHPDRVRRYRALRYKTHMVDEAEQNRVWRAKNLERVRDRRLLRKYGLTRIEWNRLFEFQGKVCAICGSEKPTLNRSWATDHNHDTGKVRGILCYQCNLLVGYLELPQVSMAQVYLAHQGVIGNSRLSGGDRAPTLSQTEQISWLKSGSEWGG